MKCNKAANKMSKKLFWKKIINNNTAIVASVLKEQEAIVIYRRFYLNETLKEIANFLQITTKDARQIQERGLLRIKSNL